MFYRGLGPSPHLATCYSAAWLQCPSNMGGGLGKGAACLSNQSFAWAVGCSTLGIGTSLTLQALWHRGQANEAAHPKRWTSTAGGMRSSRRPFWPSPACVYKDFMIGTWSRIKAHAKLCTYENKPALFKIKLANQKAFQPSVAWVLGFQHSAVLLGWAFSSSDHLSQVQKPQNILWTL